MRFRYWRRFFLWVAVGLTFVQTTRLTAVIAQSHKRTVRVSQGFHTTHVTLYDCGVAQIEKQTYIKGDHKLKVDVTRTHLDDLLASLVFATDDRVRIKGVSYPSVRNLGQSLAASGLARRLGGVLQMRHVRRMTGRRPVSVNSLKRAWCWSPQLVR